MSRRSSRGHFQNNARAGYRTRSKPSPYQNFLDASNGQNNFHEPFARETIWQRLAHWFSPHILQELFHRIGAMRRGGSHSGASEFDSGGVLSAGLGLSSLLNALDWESVRAEVDRESRAHVVLIGGIGAGKTTLLYQLKGFAPEEEADELDTERFENASEETMGGRVENLGFFALIDVPAASPNGSFSYDSAIALELENADVIVWVMDASVGLRTWEYEWLQRVRALGKALLLVANKMDRVTAPEQISKWERALGCEILPIAAKSGMNVASRLVPRLADASPHLATALGREVASWRRDAAGRVIQRAAMLSGLTGLEPVPLLDIPFQIFIQLQMVLRLAAIYGQPLNDRYSREMLTTMVSAVGLRFAGGQLVKAIPLVGWLASGGLAAAGTWTIGRIGVEYFEHGKSVRLPQMRWRWFWEGDKSERRETRSENREMRSEESDQEKEGDAGGAE